VRRHRLLIVCSGLLLIVVAAIALQGAARFGPMVWVPTWTQPTGPAIINTNVASATPAPRSTGHTTQIDLSWMLVLAAVVVIAVVAALIWRALRKRSKTTEHETAVAAVDRLGEELPTASEPDVPQVRRGLDRALDILGERRQPRDAIEQAWLGLQEAAEESGVRRLPAETPGEFTARILSRVGADRQAATTLLDLYLETRFSDAPVTAAHVESARGALESLRASWAGSEYRGTR
jgi:hypothetical protein